MPYFVAASTLFPTVTAILPVKEGGFDDGSPTITGNSEEELRFIGYNLHNSTIISFTHTDCVSQKLQVSLRDASEVEENGLQAVVRLNLPSSTKPYFLCISNGTKDRFYPGAKRRWLSIYAKEKYLLPVWFQIIVSIFLLFLSAMFSGLTLGLMTLDKAELKVLLSVGSPTEKAYAKKIEPLRRRGNFLLCVLVLGNVLVNTTLTLLMDNLIGNGWQVVVLSTLSIVIFGEIVPQAVCSRYGLAVGARTVLITYFFMVITAPLAYPLSKFLDLVLGEEIGQVFNRDRLREMVRITENTDLKREEVDIITGVLGMTTKTAKDIMTLKQDVYMLDYNNTYLNFNTVAEINSTGYTRIPIYENDKDHIVGLLNVKDLALLDPDDNLPLATIIKSFSRPCQPVDENIPLPELLQAFRKGHYHLAPVTRQMHVEGQDPYVLVVGIVTMEDVLEEIIGAEINDETDVLSDNREKKRLRKAPMHDYKIFQNQTDRGMQTIVSEQLALAAYHFLSTMVEPFRPTYLTANVLRRLLNDCIVSYKYSATDECVLYQLNKPADYFVLLLEGRVRVEAGKEKLIFEAGPFHSFGISTLNIIDTPKALFQSGTATPAARALGNSGSIYDPQASTPQIFKSPLSPSTQRGKSGSIAGSQFSLSFVPDYTAQALTDLVYVKVDCKRYFFARRFSMLSVTTGDAAHAHLGDSVNAVAMENGDIMRRIGTETSAIPIPGYNRSNTVAGVLTRHRLSGSQCSGDTVHVDAPQDDAEPAFTVSSAPRDLDGRTPFLFVNSDQALFHDPKSPVYTNGTANSVLSLHSKRGHTWSFAAEGQSDVM